MLFGFATVTSSSYNRVLICLIVPSNILYFYIEIQECSRIKQRKKRACFDLTFEHSRVIPLKRGAGGLKKRVNNDNKGTF